MSTFRLVSRAWNKRIEKNLARHMLLCARYVAGSGDSDVEYYARSIRKPIITLMHMPSVANGTVYTCEAMTRQEHFEGCHLLDVIDCTEAVNAVDVGSSHTVRLLRAHHFEQVLHYLYVPRIILWITPFTRRAPRLQWFEPDHRANRDPQTSKMVFNSGGPEDIAVEPPEDCPNIPQVVVIFHRWDERHDEDIDGILNKFEDPRAGVALAVLWGLLAGASVTVVNIEQLAFFTNEPSSGPWGASERAGQQGFKHCLEETRSGLVAPEGTLDTGAVRFLTTGEYIAEIGLEEFKIEAMLDCDIASYRQQRWMYVG